MNQTTTKQVAPARCYECGKPGHTYLCDPCAAREAADVANPVVIADGLGPVVPVPADDDGSPYTLEAWAASDGSRWGQP